MPTFASPPVGAGVSQNRTDGPQIPLFMIEDVDYTYPEVDGVELDLRPGSDLHDRLVELVKELASASMEYMQPRFAEWNAIDETMTAFVPLDSVEEARKASDDRKPVSIVMPTLYQNIMANQMYYAGTFSREPMWELSPGGPEDTIGAKKLEAVLHSQNNAFSNFLSLYTAWRDGFTKIGAIAPTWKRITRRRFEFDEVSEGVAKSLKGRGVSVDSGLLREIADQEVVYEGTQFEAINPFNLILDPNVSTDRFQQSEYAGYGRRTNLMGLLSEEAHPESNMFNVKYLQDFKGGWTSTVLTGLSHAGYNTRYGQTPSTIYKRSATSALDTITMFVQLIPKWFELGDGEYPELWKLEVAADGILIRAHQVKEAHGMIPMALNAPNFDGHEMVPVSTAAIGYGQQKLIDWFWNTHVANTLKSLHNMLVLDPEVIYYPDAKRPGPGKIIRVMRSKFQNAKISDAIMQLKFDDVTRNFPNDAMALIQSQKDIMGTNDIAQGNMGDLPDRPTQLGLRNANQASRGRMQMMAIVTHWLMHRPLAIMQAYNTQQFMSQDMQVKILGRLSEDLVKEFGSGVANVSPNDLDVRFDIEPHDGALPGTENIEAMTLAFQAVAGNVEAIGLDPMFRLLYRIMRASGDKNAQDFLPLPQIQTQSAPEEEVIQQRDQGNLVPIGEVA